jgi:hypothetical protein
LDVPAARSARLGTTVAEVRSATLAPAPELPI